jgi:GNAT superfamily N-acetyltransferase
MNYTLELTDVADDKIRRLMAVAEEEAVRRGCRNAWLDTHEFQAPGFYEKLGYAVFGKLADYPPGFARIFLTEHLTPP